MTRKNLSFEVNPLFSGPTLDARTRTGSPFRFLPIADIDVDPDQPRRVFNTESIAELAASISQFGVLCPILVKPTDGGTFRLVSGERRLRACKLLGLDTVPAILDSDNKEDADTLLKQIVENVQREDLSSMERALAIGQLRERFSLSVRDIASRLGISKSMVQRSMEVLALPDDLQAALIAGAPESKVLLLAQVKDKDERKRLLGEIDAFTRDELEVVITALLTGTTEQELSHRGTVARNREVASLTLEDQRIIQEIQQSIGLKVQLHRSTKKPELGKLVLEFYSSDDLAEIYRKLINA